MWLFILKLKLKTPFLSPTHHISIYQESYVASGYHMGECKFREHLHHRKYSTVPKWFIDYVYILYITYIHFELHVIRLVRSLLG